MPVQVCLSPALLPLYDVSSKIVVVTDVLRATTTMITALEVGVTNILPVASRSEAQSYIGKQNYLVAGERDGKKVPGFDLGNSPLGIRACKEELLGQTLVITTTNGTKAIKQSEGAQAIYIGALTNVQSVANRLAERQQDVLVVCAGWKNRVNLEDSLFAGAFCEAIKKQASIYGDAAIMSQQLFVAHQDHLFESIQEATHYQRLKSHGIEDDVRFCMSLNTSELVPMLHNEYVVRDQS